jgi:hypothetical protein
MESSCPLGTIATRGKAQGLQFLPPFDTRGHAAQPGRFCREITGSPLHCFAFRVPG